jgi:hypothetical protein
MKRYSLHLFCLLASLTLSTEAALVTHISSGSTWKYFLGTQPASTPEDAWRAIGFNDGSWPSGPSPLGYNSPAETVLPNPNTTTPYQSVYFRKTFNVANPADVVRLNASIGIDDGYVAWINGVEIGRDNVPAGELFFNSAAQAELPEHVSSISISNNLSSLLVPGVNVLAIHAFNVVLPDEYMIIDMALTSLTDDQPPVVISQLPEAGTRVSQLISVEVTFSETVTGVNASDLLINGTPATDMVIATPSQYQFTFPQPATTGTVQVTWAVGHGITDAANTPNAFGGAGWTYNLDTNFVPQVVINEFLADNSGDLNNAFARDDDGRSSDWIELFNRGGDSVNLAGWSITDNSSLKRKYVFPAVTLLPGAYLVIWAANPPTIASATRIYTGFGLDAGGEYLGLFDAQTNLQSEFFASNPLSQSPDISYGRDQGNPNLVGYFSPPSPEGPNTTALSSAVGPEVVFSRSGGSFTEPFQLTLTTPGAPGATIRYSFITGATVSTSNTLPTTASNLYVGPITITNTVVIRARAFVSTPNALPGPPSSECYVRVNTNLTAFSSDLPIVVLHTVGSGAFPSGYPAPERVTILQVFDTKYGRSSLTNQPDLSIRAGVNTRGSSTESYPKSSWAVETWDEFNEDVAVEILGMPGESDWVLYAPNHFDKVLIHNPVAYEVSNELGRYASRTRMVEVFVATGGGALSANVGASGAAMGHYNGVYVLEEKPKRDGDRIDVEQLHAGQTNASTISGGYVLKIDRQDADETASAFTGGNQTMIFVYPDPLDMATPQRVPQRNWIMGHFNTFYNVLTNVNWTNPVTGYRAFIDVDSWIDHNMLGVLTLNADWLRLSGYFFKDRGKKIEMGPVWDHDRAEGTSPGPGMAVDGDWRAFGPRNWNASGSLGGGGDYGTDFFNTAGVFANPWYRRLFTDPDFWQVWIDRYQEFRQQELSSNNIVAIIDKYANQVRQAQVREVARWGGNGGADTRPRNGVVHNAVGGTGLRGTAYTNLFDGTYQGEVDFLKRWWMDRLNFIDTNFINKPLLSHLGGEVANGLQVSIADLSGKPGTQIYYTVDGSDPRAPGGGIANGAQLYGSAVTINANTRIVARARNVNHRNLTGANNPPTNSVWSGPVAATYVINTPALRITEIMYHPLDPAAGNTNDDNNFEYIEVKNIGGTTLNLSRFALTEGVHFEFPSVTLLAGESAVVVSHTNAFRSRYGNGPRVLGVYEGRLDNAGERVVLEGPLKEPIHDFEYDDDWHPATDGFGFSLVIVSENGPLSAWGLKTGWRPSTAINGSPSANDPAAPNIPQVVINEVLTHTDPPQVDAIELRNLSGAQANIGGWFLTDDFSDPKKFVMTNGTVIAANGFRAFLEGEFDVGLTGFALSEHGEEVWLFSGDGVNLTGYAHGFDFGAAANGVSFGRHVISTGADHFPAQAGNTLNFANTAPLIGPIIVNEIAYHPPPIVVGPVGYENFDDEYIEIYNVTGSSVPLYDPSFPTNRWQLRDAVDFVFPQTNMPPNSYALVVSFNPADPNLLAAFRSRVGVSPSVPIFGPFSGRLDNNEDSVELVKPGVPEPPGPPDFGLVPEILVERVRYQDESPWPLAADGFGPSLQRVSANTYGNDPVNWVAAARTPGTGYGGGSVPIITGHPTNQTVVAFSTVTFTVEVSGTGNSYQWLFNSNTIPGATSSQLVLPNVQPHQEGFYSVLVMNAANSVVSSDAFLNVLIPATILQQPQDIFVRGSTNLADFGHTGSNVTLTAVAVSENPPLTYQWRRDGTNILGATAPSYTINALSIPDEGTYDVVVTDGIGSLTSQPAEVGVMCPLVYIDHPLSQIRLPGETASMTVRVRAHPLPVTYRWRTNIFFVTNVLNSLEDTVSFVVPVPLTNGGPIAGAAAYSLVATNRATPFGGAALLSRFAYITVVIPPTNEIGVAQSSVTLRARASSPSATLAYQWKFSGANIPGATSTNLVLNNLRPHHAGIYTFAVTNTTLNANTYREFDAVLSILEPDTDGDGAPDWHEVDSGTDPGDPQSNFRITDIDKDGSGATIEFLAIANRTYSVQYSVPLDPSSWLKLVDVEARLTNRVERILDPSGESRRYYRLITPQAP